MSAGPAPRSVESGGEPSSGYATPGHPQRKPNLKVRVTTRRESALEVTIMDGDGTALLALTGALDIATTDGLERMVLDALEGRDGVLLDLAGLTVCDSTGLGALVRLHRRAQAAGQAFELTHPRAHVADLLAMTGINKVIPVVG